MIAACLAAALSALVATDTLACSVAQSPTVAIQCAGREALVSGDPGVGMVGDGSRGWDRQRAIDDLAGACGPYTDELNAIIPEQRPRHPLYGKWEWFLLGGVTLIVEPWSPAREAELVAAQRRFSLDQCGAVAFARDGNWIKRTVQMQPYCYEFGRGGGSCPTIRSSPTLYLPYLLSRVNLGVGWYLLPYLCLFGSLIAAGIILLRRGELLRFLVPTPFRVCLVLIVGFFLFSSGFLVDLLPATLIAYFVAGPGQHLRRR